MRLHLDDPPRLSERRDQPDLVERIAAQALRDMPPPAQLSPSALARIASAVDRHGAPERRRGRLGWMLAATAFLLGFATAASAAHLDLVPTWLSRLVHPISRLVSHPHPSPTVVPRPSSSQPALVPLSEPSVAAPVAAPLPPVVLAEPTIQPSANPVVSQTAFALPLSKSEGNGDGEQVPGQQPRKPRPEGRAGDRGAAKPNPAPLAMLTAEPRPQPSLAAIEAPAFAALPKPAPSMVSQTPSPPTVARLNPSEWAIPTEEPGPQPSPVAVKAPASVPSPRPGSSIVSQAPSPPIVAAPNPSPKDPSFQAGANQTAKHLKQVIQALRVDHSPKNALALLDRHRIELDRSAFRGEALVLRVETMLSLGQRTEVLRLLDGTPLTDVVASHALLVTRGELRAAANRCEDGIGDFDLVIAMTRRPPKQALLGRAACREQLGDHVGAQADLQSARSAHPGE
jgi:hypothetical protein